MATGGELADLTDPGAVRLAMARFRELGRDAFIAEYSVPEAGFDRSRDHFVVEDGVGYDSKPLAAAAYGFQHGRANALHSDDFTGGAPVIARMNALGFQVSRWMSPAFVEGDVYARLPMRERFGIVDANFDNGVFRLKDTNSIWLFVTRDKTKDRTQYKDRLEGDILQWQGQIQGRTDRMIIDHEVNGDELIVFYRESKRQYPEAGFRYEGQFRYVAHAGGKPTNFTLQRWTGQASLEVPDKEFDPNNLKDGREKILRAVTRRQGQPRFRRDLLAAYGGKCAVTGCGIEALLEAAHIRPFLGEDTNVTQNGLLLRADIHTLFDLGLISVAADGGILTSEKLINTEYAGLSATSIRSPVAAGDSPSTKALAWHRAEHGYD